ncbi:MAG: hypothetical protein WKI04_07440 [Ferruginibacter sp.]
MDDMPLLAGTLFAACFDSPVAHGSIQHLHVTMAESSPGVVCILTHKDITGINQIGGIVPDEELWAEELVHFCGMPIALVIAQTEQQARAAVKKIKVQIEPLPVITDAREAAAKGELIVHASLKQAIVIMHGPYVIIFLKGRLILTGRSTCTLKHRDPTLCQVRMAE